MSEAPRRRVVELEQTCTMCPSQWKGRTDDGGWVYVRYRWGGLQVGFGATYDAAIGDETVYLQLGHQLDGLLSYGELIAATQDRVDWPVSR